MEGQNKLNLQIGGATTTVEKSFVCSFKAVLFSTNYNYFVTSDQHAKQRYQVTLTPDSYYETLSSTPNTNQDVSGFNWNETGRVPVQLGFNAIHSALRHHCRDHCCYFFLATGVWRGTRRGACPHRNGA